MEVVLVVVGVLMTTPTNGGSCSDIKESGEGGCSSGDTPAWPNQETVVVNILCLTRLMYILESQIEQVISGQVTNES